MHIAAGVEVLMNFQGDLHEAKKEGLEIEILLKVRAFSENL